MTVGAAFSVQGLAVLQVIRSCGHGQSSRESEDEQQQKCVIEEA